MFSRPAVMALEDRGVERETFMTLQEETKRKIYTGEDSLKNFSELIEEYHLGGKFYLSFVLEQLIKLGLDFKDGTDKRAIKNAFFKRLLRFSIHHSLREVKFKARIRVPESYQLVGVADEGRAYIEEGVSEDDVFTLKPGEIYGTFSRQLQLPAYYPTRSSLCARKGERATQILQWQMCHLQEPSDPPWRRYVH
jgi:RNA-dependent RNA polymerase